MNTKESDKTMTLCELVHGHNRIMRMLCSMNNPFILPDDFLKKEIELFKGYIKDGKNPYETDNEGKNALELMSPNMKREIESWLLVQENAHKNMGSKSKKYL